MEVRGGMESEGEVIALLVIVVLVFTAVMAYTMYKVCNAIERAGSSSSDSIVELKSDTEEAEEDGSEGMNEVTGYDRDGNPMLARSNSTGSF